MAALLQLALLLSLCAHLVAPLSSAADARSLLQVKAGISSDPLGALSSWNLTAKPDVCSWEHVSCSAAGRVNIVNLQSFLLEGSISASIGNLSGLGVSKLNSLSCALLYLHGTLSFSSFVRLFT